VPTSSISAIHLLFPQIWPNLSLKLWPLMALKKTLKPRLFVHYDQINIYCFGGGHLFKIFPKSVRLKWRSFSQKFTDKF
jgi:hypothetical protein